MRRGRHQEQMAADGTELFAQLVALGLFQLAPPKVGRHLVRLVYDDQVPIAALELLLQAVIAGDLVQADDGPVLFQEGVAADGGFVGLAGQDLEPQLELEPELILPLVGQVARCADEAALHVAAGHQLLDEQAGHDGLAGAGVVGQQEAQRLAGQHLAVDTRDLVRQGLDQRRVDGEDGIEQVGQVDA